MVRAVERGLGFVRQVSACAARAQKILKPVSPYLQIRFQTLLVVSLKLQKKRIIRENAEF